MCVARNEELCNVGDYKIINLLGESVIILKSEDSQFRGFINLCKHRGCQLLDSEGETSTGNLGINIRCPYHSWTYNLRGN